MYHPSHERPEQDTGRNHRDDWYPRSGRPHRCAPQSSAGTCVAPHTSSKLEVTRGGRVPMLGERCVWRTTGCAGCLSSTGFLAPGVAVLVHIIMGLHD